MDEKYYLTPVLMSSHDKNTIFALHPVIEQTLRKTVLIVSIRYIPNPRHE